MTEKYILKEVKKVIHLFDLDAQVILFGSRARGNAEKDSDWDILILTSYPFDEKKKRAIIEVLFYTELATDQIISPIIHTKKYWTTLKVTPLYHNVEFEGIEI